jgi:hypothetical protein
MSINRDTIDQLLRNLAIFQHNFRSHKLPIGYVKFVIHKPQATRCWHVNTFRIQLFLIKFMSINYKLNQISRENEQNIHKKNSVTYCIIQFKTMAILRRKKNY